MTSSAADDSPPVVRVQPRRCGRVERFQPLMKRPVAAFKSFLFQSLAQTWVGRRSFKQAPQQGFQIHGGPPDEDNAFAPGLNFLDDRCGPAAIIRHACLLPWVQHIDQVMRHSPTLGQRGFGSPDVHTAIESHRVKRDDLGIQPCASMTPTAVFPEAVGPVR